MKKMMTGVLVFLIAVTLGAGVGFAGNGNDKGGNGGGTQDRKRDGSCSFSIDGNQQLHKTLVKDQTRDRKKDNTCKS